MWPTVSVWHGTADHIVDQSNGDRIVEQWLAVHGLASQPSNSDVVDGYPHRQWAAPGGAIVVEEYRITGMAHGTPLATHGADGCGVSGAYMLEVAISSTRHIARFWGLTDGVGRMRSAGTHITPTAPVRPRRLEPETDAPAPTPPASGAGKIIEDALRAAGLMR